MAAVLFFFCQLDVISEGMIKNSRDYGFHIGGLPTEFDACFIVSLSKEIPGQAEMANPDLYRFRAGSFYLSPLQPLLHQIHRSWHRIF